MIIGVPREIKADEYRVAMLPYARKLAVNTQDGRIVNQAVAEVFPDLPFLQP